MMDDHAPLAAEIRTARLWLRRPIRGDVDVIYLLHNDRRACAHNPSDILSSRAAAEDLYHRWNDHWQRHGFGYWAISNRLAGEPLGFCGLKLMQLHNREVLNLFYRLDPSAWGRGIATEAAAAAVDWAITHRPDRPLIARIRPNNGASLRVATRVGLQRTEYLDCPGADGLDWIFALNWNKYPDPDGTA